MCGERTQRACLLQIVCKRMPTAGYANARVKGESDRVGWFWLHVGISAIASYQPEVIKKHCNSNRTRPIN